jgi:fumarylacetoacetate (FAA) hydrolase
MKLASYQDGTRDGQLVVVSRDLRWGHYATGVATRLQQVLDDWDFLAPQLEDLSAQLEQGRLRHAFAFDAAQCMAPLPRAHAYFRSQTPLPTEAAAPSAPQLRVASGQQLLGACAAVRLRSEKMDIDFEAGLAAITADVPQGTPAPWALERVRLLMLCNSVRLRHIDDPALDHPASVFGPVAITPDALGAVWQGGRIHLGVHTAWNGKRVGLCDAAAGMPFDFGALIAHLAQTAALGAGCIIGSGPVSDPDPTRGYSCIAHKRALEAQQSGASKLEFMRYGDTVRIEMKGPDGLSLFGAVDHSVIACSPLV